MNDDKIRADSRILGVETEDLDGHTLEELNLYLEQGRTPQDPSIESSAGCRLALDVLQRLHDLAPELLIADAEHAAQVDDRWIQKVLHGITLDARAGRRVPIPVPEARSDLGITEGAIRGLIRAVEKKFPGCLFGRCHLDGDITQPGSPVKVRVEVSIPWKEPILRFANQLRREIFARLDRHTELKLIGIDITVHDVQSAPSPSRRTDENA